MNVREMMMMDAGMMVRMPHKKTNVTDSCAVTLLIHVKFVAFLKGTESVCTVAEKWWCRFYGKRTNVSHGSKEIKPHNAKLISLVRPMISNTYGGK